MSSKTITFTFSLGDKVMVREIQRPGRVELVQLDMLGTMYRVAFWDNAERKSVWLYADELEAR